jgi:hypothetical protein
MLINTTHVHGYSTDGVNGRIYQMKCPDCPMMYVEQTGREFNVGYKENINALRNNNSNFGSSNYIQSTCHIYIYIYTYIHTYI